MAKTSKPNPYEIVTQRILAEIDAGVAPWQKPWATIQPRSMSTNKPYRGINLFLLGSGYWGTYKKITELGGQVKKGETSSLAVFWSLFDGHDKDGNEKKVPVLRYFNVFHQDQAEWPDGVPERFKAQGLPGTDNERVAAAEQIVLEYKKADNAPTFLPETGNRACYAPKTDEIEVPSLASFISTPHYYSTLFHEMGHSTGHGTRLAREGVTDFDAFGSHQYAQEELVAEMTAAMLMGTIGMVDDTIKASASYLSNWRSKISDDPKLIVRAAGQAQKAADLILGVEWDE
jgi:antirestriction protein ArdC